MGEINEQGTISNDIEVNQLTKRNLKFRYPWLSIITSLLLIGFIIISADQRLSVFYQIPDLWQNQSFKLAIMAFIGIVYLLDIRLFTRKKNQIDRQLDNLKQQLAFVSQSKKKQQQRANTFSDHTEKLKSFISDKLLEYTEYDEKFIHFKGIASEVRHNGVISYDKIVTALNKAIQQQHFLSLYEQNNDETESNNHTISALTDYQSALDAMRYLWDLLDLSTADNMALHIGNKLIECEEHYYQLQLDSDQALDITQSIPVSPTFFPQIAVLMTFSLISDDIEIRNVIALAKINEAIMEKQFHFENNQFHIALEPTPELLGNHNHIVLLLENLIKNAQFFINKNRYKQKTDKIIVRLFTEGNNAHFSIYNRGPQIKAEDHQEIFKLGFSTRKNKQHHGKGLGLFFANEIVRGYQGSIQANNIENLEADYLLKLNLTNGESINYKISSQFESERMLVKLDEDKLWQNEFIIQQDIPIDSIEVTTSGGDLIEKTQLLESIEQTDEFNWLEPADNFISKWVIQLKPYKKQHKLVFQPLDIRGVCFNIKLPTAASHLNE